MAIKIQGTTVIDDSRNLINIISLTGTDATFSGTSAIKLPSGTTAQQPAAPAAGSIRFNTDLNYIEYFDGTQWTGISKMITGKMYFIGSNASNG